MELKSEKSMIEIIKYSLCAIYRLYVKNQSELNIYFLSYFTYLNLFPIILCLFIDKLLPKCHFFLVGLELFLKGSDFKMHVKMVNILIKLQVNVRKPFVIETLIEDL